MKHLQRREHLCIVLACACEYQISSGYRVGWWSQCGFIGPSCFFLFFVAMQKGIQGLVLTRACLSYGYI